ncbi:hypothetical protein BH10BAC5_BH10BAC5_00290 [soil metagenome]
MLKSKFLTMLFSVLFVIGAVATGFSHPSNNTSVTEIKDDPSNGGVNGYKVKKKASELVASSNLKSKTTINKGNLESLSSSLAGFVETDLSTVNISKDEMMYKIIEYINTPYLWGGTTKRGIDCSAFIQTIMYQAYGVTLPRTSLEQSNVGTDVALSDLKFGDLLFFDTMHKGRTTHVGMYLGDGFFAHSGSSTGVIVTSLDKYSNVFLKSKRVIGE